MVAAAAAGQPRPGGGFLCSLPGPHGLAAALLSETGTGGAGVKPPASRGEGVPAAFRRAGTMAGAMRLFSIAAGSWTHAKSSCGCSPLKSHTEAIVDAAVAQGGSELKRIAYTRFPWAAPSGGVLGTEAVAAPLLLSAGYFLVRERVQLHVRGWMPLAALLAAAVTYTYREPIPWWLQPVAAPMLLAFTVNHLAEAPAWFRRLLALPGIRLLGLWSYSIYLWQQPFFVLRHHMFPGAGLLLAVGACSFYFFENPIRTALNRRWRGREELHAAGGQ